MSGDDDSHLEWEEEYREKESSFGIFDVYRVTRVSPKGRRGNFVVVDAPDWVTVVPVLRNKSGVDCFLMVRQFRHGSRKVTLEFPAGVIDWTEEPEEAARRELIEETGRSPRHISFLGRVNPNPAFMSNMNYTFLASGLDSQRDQSLDKTEEVDIQIVPVDAVARNMGTPPYDNAIMMSALAYYLRWKRTASKDAGRS